MNDQKKFSFGANFRKFFVHGLAILLPTVLTIWMLLAAYQFVQGRIAQPINAGVRELIVRFTDLPKVVAEDEKAHETKLKNEDPTKIKAWRDGERYEELLRLDTRRDVLGSKWASYSAALDWIGLVLAIALIYIVGIVVTSFIGRRLYHRGEVLINRVPLIRRVYPAVKQVTDFFMGAENKGMSTFSRVVAVEYPRKGLWSIGLVTGQTMRDIESRAGVSCLTVFIPSSPTPFTGYVITVPKSDTIDVPISVEDALKFSVSGGVVIPRNQEIHAGIDWGGPVGEARTPSVPRGPSGGTLPQAHSAPMTRDPAPASAAEAD